MHFFSRAFSFLVLLGFSLICSPGTKADNVHAILKIGRSAQRDSLGYNIVQQFLLAAYPHLVSGELRLWTSPEKKASFSTDSLNALEKTNAVSFYDINYIFLYEDWQVDKKQIRFHTKGYLLAYKNQQTQAVVSFGYIDHEEILKYLKSYKLPANASGWSSVNLYQAIDRRLFDYQLYVLNGKNFESEEEARKALSLQIGTRQIEYESDSLELSKILSYRIIRDTSKVLDPQTRVSNYFLNVLEDKFNENRLFIKYCISRSLDRPLKMLIAELKFKEKYVFREGQWLSKLKGLSFTDTENNNYLIPLEDLPVLNIRIENKSVEAFLKEKEYYHFLLEKINEQYISPAQAQNYKEAIISGNLQKLNANIK